MRELRQNLSVWLRRVQAGEAFRVTERGKPVALLSGVVLDEDLEDLVAAGVLAPAPEPDAPVLAPRPAVTGALSASAALDDLREEEDR